MRFLTLNEVVKLHRQLLTRFGGTRGIRDWGALESAIAQPRMTFGGEELYPSVVEKSAALGYSLIKNHPFVDGNKRVGHAAMEVFLVLNGYEIGSSVDKQEQVILQVASGEIIRGEFEDWLRAHLVARRNSKSKALGI
ncbi:MAG TPA: type II toxin-antitoxin system death-on-curing family toxin [Thermoflexia bacterium]|nr:type II toxin-antitoxin system death-on-curing family toxin [Thermoflexia bacterium]